MGSGIQQSHPAQLSAKEIPTWPLDYSTSPPQDKEDAYEQVYTQSALLMPLSSLLASILDFTGPGISC